LSTFTPLDPGVADRLTRPLRPFGCVLREECAVEADEALELRAGSAVELKSGRSALSLMTGHDPDSALVLGIANGCFDD
jgi:hypothetical protein